MSEESGFDLEPMAELLAVMARLRDPEHGCPWDRRQRFATIAPYTVEEAYEVADAIDREAIDELPGELGDLLFQVVFHARMAEEAGYFDFADVARAIVDKMVRRHPHVFGDAEIRDEAELKAAWEREKEREREARAGDSLPTGALHGVARALPALVRAQKLQKRAARVGTPFPTAAGELEAKLAAVETATDRNRLDAVGEVLFAAVSLAREQGVDAEQALRHASNRFEARFGDLEEALAEEGETAESAPAARLERIWEGE